VIAEVASIDMTMNPSMGKTEPGVKASHGRGVSKMYWEVTIMAAARDTTSVTATDRRNRERTIASD
jgi:hypothetical protein